MVRSLGIRPMVADLMRAATSSKFLRAMLDNRTIKRTNKVFGVFVNLYNKMYQKSTVKATGSPISENVFYCDTE